MMNKDLSLIFNFQIIFNYSAATLASYILLLLTAFSIIPSKEGCIWALFRGATMIGEKVFMKGHW